MKAQFKLMARNLFKVKRIYKGTVNVFLRLICHGKDFCGILTEKMVTFTCMDSLTLKSVFIGTI